MATHHDSTGYLVAQAAGVSLAPLQHGFLERARSLHQGAAALAAQDASHAHATVFLAAWCAELSLKAYLAKHGQFKEQLGAIQHNLSGLWKKAASLGLSVPQDPPRWLQLLGTLHGNPYHLRYPSEAAASLSPAANEAVVGLGNLIQVVEKAFE